MSVVAEFKEPAESADKDVAAVKARNENARARLRLQELT
jgi:hypothetical protein